jgi:hypothetical protein
VTRSRSRPIAEPTRERVVAAHGLIDEVYDVEAGSSRASSCTACRAQDVTLTVSTERPHEPLALT